MLKILNNFFKLSYKNEKGNASIEYVLILAMIVTIVFAFFSISLSMKRAINSSTCKINCTIAESQYNDYLRQRGILHSDTLYSKFIQIYVK